MARNVGTVLQNNLSRGLITEATGLNFPDNAVTDADNVVFDPIGSVRRRKGFDIEGSAIAKAYKDSDGLIKEFLWQSVARTGGFTFLVLQMGDQVYFYELTTSDALSAGVVPTSLDLTAYKAPGAGDLRMTPCTFASGAGYLFVAHPNCDPVIVKYDEEDNKLHAARIPVVIRDFEGVEDETTLLENPKTLSKEHLYNLQNQGWYQAVRVGTTVNELAQTANSEAISADLLSPQALVDGSNAIAPVVNFNPI